jgi:hypothetical protein
MQNQSIDEIIAVPSSSWILAFSHTASIFSLGEPPNERCHCRSGGVKDDEGTTYVIFVKVFVWLYATGCAAKWNLESFFVSFFVMLCGFSLLTATDSFCVRAAGDALVEPEKMTQ